MTLPDGETVTAASPQLAAAIKAAVGGAPIADAFHQQGITIPPPGTAVANPIDPPEVIPGDIGMFTDRHALALGHRQGASRRPNSTHRHRERAELSRLGASAGGDRARDPAG